ncbi:hypothetical protein [Intrasporangium sp. YIM S08009]|uniref:hypothetical protein n=1 Tax=Intrasporangium zincisolvens TaxID=3080018 RepID=UPI002B058595|nr:hypothetical protein [Intrasporangium sp. YIM S08009]
MTVGPTYALLTRASTSELASALPVPARVGTLDGWSVAGIDPDLVTDRWPDETPDRTSARLGSPVVAVFENAQIAGLAASAEGDSEPRMFSEGWLPPRGLMGRLWVRGWRSSANDFARRAGLPDRGAALGEVRQPAPDGSSLPISTLFVSAVDALGLPASVRGTSLFSADHLDDVIDVDPGRHS